MGHTCKLVVVEHQGKHKLECLLCHQERAICLQLCLLHYGLPKKLAKWICHLILPQPVPLERPKAPAIVLESNDTHVAITKHWGIFVDRRMQVDFALLVAVCCTAFRSNSIFGFTLDNWSDECCTCNFHVGKTCVMRSNLRHIAKQVLILK